MLKKASLIFTMIALLTATATATAADLPRIAVYVTGNVAEDEKSALGTRMLASLINSGRYRGIERSAAFVAEINKEQTTQRSGAIDDSQISELGKQFGVGYICIAAITPAFGSYQVSARIVDVETAEVVFIGEATSPLKTIDDLSAVSDRVVGNMFGIQAPPQAMPAAPKLLSKPSFWVGVGLEAVGAGVIAYGLIENGNAESRINAGEYSVAKKSITSRNIAYTVGTALLLGGISIHIFF